MSRRRELLRREVNESRESCCVLSGPRVDPVDDVSGIQDLLHQIERHVVVVVIGSLVLDQGLMSRAQKLLLANSISCSATSFRLGGPSSVSEAASLSAS